MPDFESLGSARHDHWLAQTGGVAVVCFRCPDCGTWRTLERLLTAALRRALEQALAGPAQEEP